MNRLQQFVANCFILEALFKQLSCASFLSSPIWVARAIPTDVPDVVKFEEPHGETG